MLYYIMMNPAAPNFLGKETGRSMDATAGDGQTTDTAPNNRTDDNPDLDAAPLLPSSNRASPRPPPLLAGGMERLELDVVDQLVAQEMAKLSFAEREKVLQDLHAIPDNSSDEPSPEMRAKRMMEFQQALDDRIPAAKKNAYDLACQLDPSYVANERLRVQFLRTDCWNVDKAALRFTKHFEVKLELFGQNLLCKDITQDDLDAGTLEVLYSGFIQELPLRDTAGRVVTFTVPNPTLGTPLQKKRRIFYASMVQAQDEETQVKGRVVITWMTQEHGIDPAAAWEIGKLTTALPARLVATHMCIPGGTRNYMHESGVALFIFAVESLMRLRIKSHFGTPLDVKEKLKSFGIPSFLIPISDDGQVIKKDANLKWMKRRLEERQRHASPPASVPLLDANNGDQRQHNQEDPNNVAPSAGALDDTWATSGTSEGEDSATSTSLSMDDPLFSNSNDFAAALSASTNYIWAADSDIDMVGAAAHQNAEDDEERAPEVGSSIAQHFRLDPVSTYSHGNMIRTPSNNDVLLGRGRLCQRHVGNVQFRAFIDNHQSIYDSATKVQKTLMAAELVRLVKTSHGRFLKEEGSGWCEVPDSIARTKVATCFRTFRHRKKKGGGGGGGGAAAAANNSSSSG